MPEHQRFKFRSLQELATETKRLGLDLPMQDDTSVLATPVSLGRHTLANRFAVNPMEGFDAAADGTPQALSFRRYRRYAEGGAALIWMEATAVMNEGRSNPGQFYLHRENVAEFARLVAETKRAGQRVHGFAPVIILQITHSGRYSKPSGMPQPVIAHRSPILDPLHNLDESYPLVEDDYLDRLQDRFVATARLAAEAGFDGVDVKSCHRYLLSELLASFTRPGKYGGSYENRTRLLRESLARIAADIPGIMVTTRINAYDAMSYPYGFGVSKDNYEEPDLTEPLQLARELHASGLQLLNISIGNPYYNPHYGRPYDFALKGMAPPPEHPLIGVNRIVQVVRTIQQAQPELKVVGSGYAWIRQFMPNVAAAVLERQWATLIAQGRGSFAYPDAVRDVLLHGKMDPGKCCVTCSACTQIMRDGGKTGCVVRDSEIYGPEYRLARRFAMDRLLHEAERCRDCEEATCTQGCPARVDIAAFVRAFAARDIDRAYKILKAANVLPEMCGEICPASEQCQGQCLENIFCEHPIPIQDIQLAVSRIARLQGITGVDLPPRQSGKRVAVVGGGPASTACAIKLLEAGHRVSIIEKSSKLGGTPHTIIPEPRYGSAEAEIDAIFKPARTARRLEERYNTVFGLDVKLKELVSLYDAVFLGFGLDQSMSLGQAEGVVDALQFLRTAKLNPPAHMPAQVAVLGAGNTAMDAATTAIRLGAEDVYIVYRRSFTEMPAWQTERDSFLEAGGHILLLTQPLGYVVDSQDKLAGLRVARTRLGAPDDSGRRRPEIMPHSEYVLPLDMVIEAMGQGMSFDLQNALEEVEITDKGLIKITADSSATSVPGVFAGGDIVNGGTTAVQAINEGMQAAAEIVRFLQ